MTEERVQKILARAGYGSRRSCEELIIAGRVWVNGIKVELGSKADISKDKIAVDGSILAKLPEARYLAFNKPRFMLCDKTQPGDDRRTIFESVPGGEELSVVGRLDFESEGLVLLTNDGELVNKLTHPRYEHEKEYRVLVASKPDQKQIDTWKRGIVLEDGYKTSPVKLTVEAQAGKGTWLRVVMKEGRKRQIRETAKLLGLFVVKIIRMRIGTIHLGTLKAGEWRELTPDEVKVLKEATGGLRRSSRRTGKPAVERQPKDSFEKSREVGKNIPEKTHAYKRTNTEKTHVNKKSSSEKTHVYEKKSSGKTYVNKKSGYEKSHVNKKSG